MVKGTDLREHVALWLFDMDYSTRASWDEFAQEHYRERADAWLHQHKQIIDAVRATVAPDGGSLT